MMSRKHISASIAVVLLLCAAATSRCPVDCVCSALDRSQELLQADCSNLSLATLPHYFSHRVVYLNASFNKFVELGSNFFTRGLQDVRSVYLNNNSIAKISENTFSSLTQLWVLDLSGNKLDSLHKNLFQNNNKLWYLILRGNNIKLPFHAPFLYAQKLRKLDLSYNNLETIGHESFDKMNELTYLRLHNNRLQSLSQYWFRGLVHMKHLFLEDNNLHYVPPDSFIFMPKLIELSLSRNRLMITSGKPFLRIPSLEVLYLNACNLTYLPHDMFVMLTRLRYVFLSDNDLTSLDHGLLNYLQDLVYLNVCDNLLECSCELKDAWEWCKYRNVKADISCSVNGTRQEFCAGSWDVVGDLPCNITGPQPIANVEDKSSSSYTGLFVGIGIFFLVIIAAAVFLVYWRRSTLRPSRNNSRMSPTSFADILPLHDDHEES